MLASVLAAMGLLAAGVAQAQQGSNVRARTRTTARPAAYEYSGYYEGEEDESSPSDMPLVPAEPPAADAPAADDAPAAGERNGAGCRCGNAEEEESDSCSSDDENGSCCREEEEEEEEPCRLFDCCCLEEKGIVINGWVDFGFTYNPADPVNPAAGNGNLPQTFNYRSNEFQLNQLYLYAEKATETSCCDCVDLGWRVDLLYGSDYIFTEALGLETHVDGSQKINSDNGNGILGDGTLGLAIPQIYAEVALSDVKVKLGHFYTPVGYETVTAIDNFFYSHALTHQYGEPFTHTGALATWAVNDQWSLVGGVTRGWDTWEDNNDDLAALAGVAWTSCDENTSWAYYIHNGDENVAGRPVGADNRFYHSFVFKQKLGCKWNWVLEHDLGIQDNGSQVSPGVFNDAEWYSVTNYLYYEINDCWSAGIRYEWFNDDDGVRATSFLVNPAGTVYDGHYQNITLGLNWMPGTNLRVRPELRWDWFDGHTVNSAGPFDNLSDAKQFTAAVDAIILF
jgi:hypothetical protein